MKYTTQQIETILQEMHKAEREHPKARVYFEDNEIRITYPLPNDFYRLQKEFHSVNVSGTCNLGCC